MNKIQRKFPSSLFRNISSEIVSESISLLASEVWKNGVEMQKLEKSGNVDPET